MTDLSPGQEVTVSGMHGGAAEVVYVRGSNVRVRMLSTHCPRTVPLSRVTPKRESKALSAAGVFDGMEAVPSTTHPFHMVIRPVPKPVTLRSEPYLAMPEPTFGHQPMTRGEARAECLRMLAKLDGVEVPRVLVQPDDPGVYARTCLRCGLDEGLGANRMCTRCNPPAPWWAHILRWLLCWGWWF